MIWNIVNAVRDVQAHIVWPRRESEQRCRCAHTKIPEVSVETKKYNADGEYTATKTMSSLNVMEGIDDVLFVDTHICKVRNFTTKTIQIASDPGISRNTYQD